MNKPVLFRVTNNLKVGGVQKRLRALLPLLTEHYEVHVVTYKDRGVFFDELAQLGVHTHFLPRKGHWNPVAIWRLAKLFRKHRADIVHTHSFGGNIFGILAAALARVPVRIGQVHLSDLHWYGTTAMRRKKQMLEERLVHRLFSHKVVFVSRESLEYFKRHTRLPDKMMTILHNGLDLPGNVEAASRTELGLPEEGKLVGFVGRIARGKGVGRFLEIARQASLESSGRYHFVIIGDGEGLSRHQAWSREQGLEPHVTFLGERHDIHRCYAALDCLIFCSDPGVEGMPGVALEACAHGLPILALKTAPLEEIHEYYPRIAFMDGFTSSAKQLEKTLALPVANQKPFRDEFSIEAMQARTLALYADLRRQATA
ncbi:Glycosyltransferase involved in cell wall bisynthesis [Desulfomicrobium norvegicum]|uniref:Glycosyltransferase involved in cell wall bisynthesis n=1 Tax=Desulfomicrobium norvegicum (strain DSM 1741 / NCIMB 8310) TaxID=52561 RepID=A0A8G2C1C4_DESNO|nr:glycosyltransferase [Desulfomicrobium norvegicum]SFL47376.1 Glycosyltransferase involved in cell wall bisynthesis [Desulfomicrobium norvegicum]